MRHGQGLLLGLLVTLCAGCLTGKPADGPSGVQRMQALHGPVGPDVVRVDIALIERPVGDWYLNKDLWSEVDEQVVGLEQKAVLRDNGFRVGQIGGMLPSGLQGLLTSASSCANPRRLQLHSGQAHTLVLGAQRPECRFQITQDGEPVKVALELAQCTLEIVPTLAPDGRVRLRITPQILHGETAMLPQPMPDISGWVLREQRPTQRYASVGWDMPLALNDYVIIGGRLDLPETLGHQSFIHSEDAARGQMLLVLRAGPMGSPSPAEHDLVIAEEPTPTTPPLALQASWATVRATSP